MIFCVPDEGFNLNMRVCRGFETLYDFVSWFEIVLDPFAPVAEKVTDCPDVRGEAKTTFVNS